MSYDRGRSSKRHRDSYEDRRYGRRRDSRVGPPPKRGRYRSRSRSPRGPHLDGPALNFYSWKRQMGQASQEEFQAYKKEYNEANVRAFWQAHKDAIWFRELYHPEELEDRLEEEKEFVQARPRIFLDELLECDSLPTWDASPYQGASEALRPAKEKELDEDSEDESNSDRSVYESREEKKSDDPPAEGRDRMDIDRTGSRPTLRERRHPLAFLEPPESPSTLFLMHIPTSVSRQDLLNHLNKVRDGEVVDLFITQVKPSHSFQRHAWVVFNSEEAAQRSLESFSSSPLGMRAIPHTTHSLPAKPLVLPQEFSRPERILKDLETIRRLARLLDTHRGIVQNIVLDRQTNDASLSSKLEQLHSTVLSDVADKQLLDLLISYCRRVHLFDYYSSTCYLISHSSVLNRMQIVRATEENDPRAKLIDPSVIEEMSRRHSLVEASLSDPDYPLGNPQAEVKQALFALDGEYFQCLVPDCEKLFRAEKFVLAHLQNKHSDVIEEKEEGAVDERFFKNYTLDPGAITPHEASLAVSSHTKPSHSESRNRGNRRNRGGQRSDHQDRFHESWPPRGRPNVASAPAIDFGEALDQFEDEIA